MADAAGLQKVRAGSEGKAGAGVHGQEGRCGMVDV